MNGTCYRYECQIQMPQSQLPERSRYSRPVLRLLRPRKRGGQSGVDDLGEVGGSQKDSTFAAAKGIHQKVVAGACQLNPFPPSLPTHAGARATLRGRRRPQSIWAIFVRLGLSPNHRWHLSSDGTLFGWDLLWSVVQSGMIPSFLYSPIYFALFLVVIMWRKMQSFLWRRFNPASTNIATNPSR